MNHQPIDNYEEKQLRQLFRQQAPKHIDVEHAWQHIKPIIQQKQAPTKGKTIIMFKHSTHQHRTPWKRIAAIAAVAVLALSIMAAGVSFFGLMNTFKDDHRALAINQVLNDPNMYTKIDQTQTQGEYTVTVDRAYIDKSVLMIVFNLMKTPSGHTAQPDKVTINGDEPKPQGNVGACDASTATKQRCMMAFQKLPNDELNDVVEITITFKSLNGGEVLTFTFNLDVQTENPIQDLQQNDDPWVVPEE